MPKLIHTALPPNPKIKLSVNNLSITPKSGVKESLSHLLPRGHGGVHGRAAGELAVRALFLQFHARLSVKLMLSLMLYDNEQYLGVFRLPNDCNCHKIFNSYQSKVV